MSGATRVMPLTRELADALVDAPDTFDERFGLTPVPGYLAFPEVLPALREALDAGTPPQWSTHLIVAGDEVVGLGGFTGAPVDGVVEIGYSIAPTRRGRGHATEAARAWVEQARAAGVDRVVAHTLPDENPSTAVLRRLGFRRDGESTDPDAGVVWRWALPLRG